MVPKPVTRYMFVHVDTNTPPFHLQHTHTLSLSLYPTAARTHPPHVLSESLKGYSNCHEFQLTVFV